MRNEVLSRWSEGGQLDEGGTVREGKKNVACFGNIPSATVFFWNLRHRVRRLGEERAIFPDFLSLMLDYQTYQDRW